MFSRLFPKVFDNTRGSCWLALVILAGLVFIKLAMGANALFNTRFVAETIDGIPLESYGGGGAEAMLAFFAIWGMGQIMLGAQGALALIRYRAMVPFVYFLMLAEQVGRKAILFYWPIETAVPPDRASPVTINTVIVAAMFAGFILSLTQKPNRSKNNTTMEA